MLKKFCLALCLGLVPVQTVSAQSIIAAPDGTGTIININGNTYTITGGTQGGNNLFHSFQELGLSPNEIANFLSTPQIQNILGRVTGGNPSVIEGLIQLTGGNSNLFLMNPAGMIFGAGASLDVPGSFTATTADAIGFDGGFFKAFGNNDYQALAGSPNSFVFASDNPGSIINGADLGVGEGQTLSLIAGTLVNTGNLTAAGGTINLTAVPGKNLVRINSVGMVLGLEVAPQSIQNGISAIALPRLLTNPNLRDATGVTVDLDGTVRLTGSSTELPTQAGTAIASGQIDVSGTVGGTVTVLGDRVAVLSGQIDASGTEGGGTVLLGGDYQGEGTIPTASLTAVSSDSIINVDAIENGNGGSAIVWAEQTTGFSGTISARGGSNSGDGGLVEVSGKETLLFDGTVDVSANSGDWGTLLLDPRNITISNTESTPDTVDMALPAILQGAFNGRDITINAENLQAQRANVILEATDDIAIARNVALDFVPGGSIVFTADADTNGVGTFVMGNGSSVATNGRDLTINAANIDLRGSAISSEGGDIQLDAPVVLGSDFDISTGAGEGDIVFTSTLDGDTTGRRNLTLEAGSGQVLIGGAIGAVTPLGNTTIRGANIIFQDYTGGHLTVRAEANITGGAITTREYQAANQIFGFESGDFTGWETIGETSVETAAFGSTPTEGTFHAFLDTVHGSENTVSLTQLETFIGTTPGSLNRLGNGNVTEGSAMKVTFAANAGDTVSFDWNFLTNEIPAPAMVNDFSFVTLTSLSELSDTRVPLTPSPTLFIDETGYQSFSATLPNSGVYALGIGVVDVSDRAYSSGLLVDNVSVFAPTPTNGAPVTLWASGDIDIVSVDTQGLNGTGSDVNITAGNRVQITGAFTDQNGITASISTAGTAGSGTINIQHEGGINNVPFIVGDATTNGTAGAITTGQTTISPLQSFPNPGTVTAAANINITFVNDPPTLSANILLTGNQQNRGLTFSWADLSPLVGDLNSDTTFVAIESILQGTLMKNGVAVTPGTIFRPGDIFVYIPPRNASGLFNAFTIRASDRVSTSLPLTIAVEVPALSSNPTRTKDPSVVCPSALKPLEIREFRDTESELESQTRLVAPWNENNCDASPHPDTEFVIPPLPNPLTVREEISIQP